MEVTAFSTTQPITTTQAAEILETRTMITDQLRSATLNAAKQLGTTHEHYVQGQQNAFLFDLQQLIEMAKNAEYLMVVMGAHPENDGGFKKGDPTVMLVPCNHENIKEQDASGRTIKMSFPDTGDDDPIGLEHPPIFTIWGFEF
ncbi:hypothetical protein [Chitinophaga flava]|uniref:Uncharacterized protein n=1 Tax=Chitinophaga flava TaxID=2259036 RepID=A0A365Y266_9BACT|nr:hypothetical protein [Chitinophaga flava]RBL92388.1 hypothetical protein DF182_07315 [Chitinophaga flava]